MDLKERASPSNRHKPCMHHVSENRRRACFFESSRFLSLHRSGRDEALDETLLKGGGPGLNDRTGLLAVDILLDVGAVDDALEMRDHDGTGLIRVTSAVDVRIVTDREDQGVDAHLNLGGNALLEFHIKAGECLATDEILTDDKDDEEGLPVLGKLVKVDVIEKGLLGDLLNNCGHLCEVRNDDI